MFSLSDYEIDPKRGFLPVKDPIKALPHQFLVWEQIASDVSSLLTANQLRSVLNQLQPLDVSALQTQPQLRRAMLLLSVFANAYVWGEEVSAPILPTGVSIPLWRIAHKLGRPPILTHASIVLDNWCRLDIDRPIELGNIKTLQLFLGGLDEQWFYLTTVAMESAGAASLSAIVNLQTAVKNQHDEAIALYLTEIAQVIIRMQSTLGRIEEHCDPYIFYYRVRPFLAGWSEPGVIYQGVNSTPFKFAGGSAAQSSLVQSLDAILGIEHQELSSRKFLHKMRLYMPPLHRRFIEEIEIGTSVRNYIVNHQASQSQLEEAYNYCIKELQEFRKKHLAIAANYILRHSSRQAKGTGGTSFMGFLKRVESNTQNNLICH